MKDPSKTNLESTKGLSFLKQGIKEQDKSGPDLKRVEEELRLHQIELELQNEELRRAQGELKTSQTRYFDLYDLAPVGYCTLSEKGLILEANLTAAALLGIARGALVTQPITRFILKEDQDIYYLLRKQLFETGESQVCELRMVKKDGMQFWARLEAVVAQGADNTPTARVVMSDITELKKAEEALRTERNSLEQMVEKRTVTLKESEERYRIAIETSNDGVAIVQNDIHIYVNRAFLDMFGYNTLDEIVGKQRYCIVHPDDHERVVNYAAARQKGESTPTRYEFKGIRSDGVQIDVEVSVNTISYNGEKAILAYLRDITERKRAEQTLKESELRYRSLIESSPDAIILHDGERIFYLNNAAKLFIGSATKGQYIGRKMLDFIHPEDRETMAHDIDSIKRTGNATSIRKVKVVRDDGTILYGEYTGSSIDYGGPRLLQIFMRDVTDRMRTEKVLDNTRQQQQAILDNIPDIAWLKDKESRFIIVNESFRKACGVNPENLPGKTDLDVWPRDLADKYRADDRAVVESGKRRQIEELLTDSDGNTIWIETIKTPIFNRGEIIGTAGIARDITLKKRQEEQLRQHREHLERIVEERTAELTKVNALLQQELSEHKRTEEMVQRLNVELEERVIELNATNKELETFNYSVSHDLKTPLIAIEGFSRILLEKHSSNLNTKGQQFLGIISKNTKKMSELIEDLHSFFSVGKKTIKSSAVDMEKMVNDIVTDFTTILPDDVFNIDFSALPTAYGDKKMIRQVLVNLFNNAIKYSKPKGAAVITVEGWTEEGKSIYSVKDKGIGFSMEDADKIFEVFERLHGPDEFEGTGIGLAIVKRIIHKHGGEVWAEAVINEGATFYLSLPGKEPVK